MAGQTDRFLNADWQFSELDSVDTVDDGMLFTDMIPAPINEIIRAVIPQEEPAWFLTLDWMRYLTRCRWHPDRVPERPAEHILALKQHGFIRVPLSTQEVEVLFGVRAVHRPKFFNSAMVNGRFYPDTGQQITFEEAPTIDRILKGTIQRMITIQWAKENDGLWRGHIGYDTVLENIPVQAVEVKTVPGARHAAGGQRWAWVVYGRNWTFQKECYEVNADPFGFVSDSEAKTDVERWLNRLRNVKPLLHLLTESTLSAETY